MDKPKKNYVIKTISFIVNLIEGAVTIIALAVSYAFIFEADNKDHDVGAGLFFLGLWLISLFAPNIFFSFFGKLNIKEMAVFQFFPLLLGAIVYIVFQFFIW